MNRLEMREIVIIRRIIRWLVPMLTLLTACGASSTPQARAPLADPAHARLYPVLSESELDDLTDAAKEKSPGWSITLDPLGFLSMAVCNDCRTTAPTDIPTISADDHARIEAFLKQQDALVALTGPYVVKKSDTTTVGLFFQQITPYGVAGFLHAQRIAGSIRISGHAWPRLPPLTGGKPDADLEASLRTLSSDPDLTFERRIRPLAHSVQGPVEIHAEACLTSIVDTMPRSAGDARPPPRPCLDAFTGEDLTGLSVGMRVSTRNDQVTERRLLK
jgi:hypothetical protein